MADVNPRDRSSEVCW